MKRKNIIKENGKLKAKIEDDGYDVTLLTMRNGFQWTGQPIDKELAKLTIEVLQEYVEKGL